MMKFNLFVIVIVVCKVVIPSREKRHSSAFKSSIKTFDNVVGNMFFRIITVLLTFQNFALKPEVCNMGGNFRLQNGLNLLCRV